MASAGFRQREAIKEWVETMQAMAGLYEADGEMTRALQVLRDMIPHSLTSRLLHHFLQDKRNLRNVVTRPNVDV